MQATTRIVTTAIAEHHRRVKTALDIIGLTTATSDVKYFAQSWLDTLASKNGNDILEPVLVEATGRDAKALTKKHGADSGDGLLESKPLKTKYAAHISDDTPASLLRHHKIPYIVLGESSSDGRVLQWALYMSYRAFDQSRYQKMWALLSPIEREELCEILPEDMEARYAVLAKLKAIWKPKNYIRSNPLPIDDIRTLKNGQFSLWLNPDVELTQINKDMVKLHETYPGSILSEEYMTPRMAMREYVLQREEEINTAVAAVKVAVATEKKMAKAAVAQEKKMAKAAANAAAAVEKKKTDKAV